MKKILFVAGISILGLSAAFAQEVKQSTSPDRTANVRKINPEMMASKRTERMTRALSLDQSQQKAVHDILLKEAQSNGGRSLQRKETDDQIKAVLNASQKTKYEEIKAEQKARMSESRSARSTDLKSPVPATATPAKQ